MFCVFVFILYINALVAANPFHKYPFVFLLDVGNEELEKTNTEQIRISVPGGSLALRYPAIGDGDTIGHVRVSGIDFGTDLKASILDGGPGYKYVVLVFMGNRDVAYDAVITVQTVSFDDDANTERSKANKTKSNTNSYQVSEDPKDTSEDTNDSSEDISDNSESKKVDTEVMQSSSKIYNYAQSGVLETDDNDGEDLSDNDRYEENDMQNQFSEDYSRNNNDYSRNSDIQEERKDYIDDSDNEMSNDFDEYKINSESSQKAENNGYSNEDDYQMEEPIGYVHNNLYEKYTQSRPRFYNNVKVYPQQGMQEDGEANSDESLEESEEIDQMFNDEEIHDDVDENKDSNNNYFDANDSSAVAS